MKIQDEKGVAMVEAIIYMPIVLCTVMTLLYIALFNLQEYMMMYEVQRVSAVAAREEAYLGYKVFEMGKDNQIDCSWGEGSLPSEETVNSYYKPFYKNLGSLYREVGGFIESFAGSSEGGKYSSKFADAGREATMIALGAISEPEVQVDAGLFGTGISVKMHHKVPLPRVMAYLGYDGSTTIGAAAYTYSVNPSQFVRNVDFSVDLVKHILDKLGIDYTKFTEYTQKIVKMIL